MCLGMYGILGALEYVVSHVYAFVILILDLLFVCIDSSYI